jgi:PTS system nitrogen regulatory IIA component
MNPADAGFFPALVDERRIFPDLAGTTRDEALAEMSAALAQTGAVSDGTELARRLIERERMGSTGLGGGLAIPHCKLHEIGDVVLAVGVSRRGIEFGAADGQPVRLVFLVLSPADAPALHLQALARISRVIRVPGVLEKVSEAATAGEIAAALKDAEARLAVPA